MPDPQTADGADAADANKATDDKKVPQTTRLLRLAETAVLFHTPAGAAFMTIPVKKHRETYDVTSGDAGRWLRSEYYRAYRTAPSDAVVRTVQQTLAARAIHDGPEEQVHLRVAEKEGVVYIDLSNETWQVLRVDGNGTRIENNAPVQFRRTAGMQKLPYPSPDGSLDDLRSFINVREDDDWTLLKAWMLGAVRPRGPYPILEVNGPQGAAKSSACRIIRSFIDPNTSALKSAPKDERDLFIQANRSWICVFDNLSGVKADTSDALCRVATGGGFGTRRLYTDDDELVIDVMRPIIINGIGPQATRGDLLDRSITITLNAITDETRQDEDTFYSKLEAARPSVFGGLVNALSLAIKNHPSVQLRELPRMADFTRWVVAGEPALGVRVGTFLRAYRNNRERVHDRVLESERLAEVLLEFIEDCHGGWQGTATALLDDLRVTVQHAQLGLKMPESASALGSWLKRLEPTLLHFGILVESSRDGHAGTRRLKIRKIAVSGVGVSTRVEEGEGMMQQ
jgi:hypothetical protein